MQGDHRLGTDRMHASTVVTRTPAGNAELATPAHGLSLAQRRFLTLLDSACSVEEIASRHRVEPEKLQRDLERLASLGLVLYTAPAANDESAGPAAPAEAAAAANDDRVAVHVVRLGASRAWLRLPYLFVALAVLLLGLVGWRILASPAPAPPPAPLQPAPEPRPVAPETALDRPEAIATKVLVGDPAAGKPRNPANETARPKSPGSEPSRSANPAAAPAPPAPLALPALRPLEARTAAPSPLVAMPLALPVERSVPTATLSSAPVVSPAQARNAPPPVQLASAAPTAGMLAPAPPRALVPLAQETPAFPREAIAAGLASGSVEARVVVDAKGGVSDVEIVTASHRAFERAVRDALSRWRFPPGPANRTTTVDIAFKRD